ncbi:MAG TPA: hypothetical protein VK764_02745, partial [Terracidiphilus sp.]|nr:hypothetical protein [Terracidiphilus sp.]
MAAFLMQPRWVDQDSCCFNNLAAFGALAIITWAISCSQRSQEGPEILLAHSFEGWRMVTRYPFVWGDSALRAAFPVTIAPEATNRVMKITRIPTLDGWRGIAILLVLIEHAQKGL